MLFNELKRSKVNINLHTDIFPLPLKEKLSLLYKARYSKPLSYPRYVWIETTNECNLRCVMCPHSMGLKRKKLQMGMNEFRVIIDQISSFKPAIFLHHSGEPLLNANLCAMIKYAKNRGCWVGIHTNATLLTQEMATNILKSSLDYISFSFDGCTSEIYEKLRVGANFEQVKSQIEAFFDLRCQMKRKKPYIQIEIILMKETQQYIFDFIRYWQVKALDRVAIKPFWLWHGLVADRAVLNIPTYGYKPCRAVFYKSAILVDGSVVPCCADIEGRLPLGNIFERPFKDIWDGELYQQLRMQHLQNSLLEDSICNKCLHRQCWSLKEKLITAVFTRIFFPKFFYNES